MSFLNGEYTVVDEQGNCYGTLNCADIDTTLKRITIKIDPNKSVENWSTPEWSNWVYSMGLKLDWYLSFNGIENTLRIEQALTDFKALCKSSKLEMMNLQNQQELIENLSTLVRRLARRVDKDIADKALNFLNSKGLKINILRDD